MRIRQRLIKSLVFGVLFLVLVFGLASVSRADDEKYYFGLINVENSLKGDFNGRTTYDFVESSTMCRVPKVDSGSGYGFLIGGIKHNLAGEIFYIRSTHETSFLGVYDFDGSGDFEPDEVYSFESDGEYEVWGFNIKHYWINLFDNRFRFCGQIGANFPKFTMEDGSYKEDDITTYSDSIFTGYGLEAGLGFLLHINKKLAINGSAVYYQIRINRLKGFGSEREPKGDFDGRGSRYTLGINYFF